MGRRGSGLVLTGHPEVEPRTRGESEVFFFQINPETPT